MIIYYTILLPGNFCLNTLNILLSLCVSMCVCVHMQHTHILYANVVWSAFSWAAYKCTARCLSVASFRRLFYNNSFCARLFLFAWVCVVPKQIAWKFESDWQVCFLLVEIVSSRVDFGFFSLSSSACGIILRQILQSQHIERKKCTEKWSEVKCSFLFLDTFLLCDCTI